MIERNHGMVVTVASLASHLPAPSMVDYAASKAAALAFHEGLATELATMYKAPKVRTVVMCQGYTRTALFEGFAGKALHPETVAEEIVKAVFEGKSKTLVLPEAAWGIVPKVRGWPLWMQYLLRKGLRNMMSGWKGRQVVQPSVAESGEKEKDVGESTVLVGKE
jgi:short-subunit dehydrogenase